MTQQIAVVTGGNRGIGLEISRQLAKKGIHVILTSRNAAKGQAAVDELGKEGLSVEHHALDVASSESIQAFGAWLRDAHGHVEILVNNAGIMIDSSRGERSVFDATPETLQETMQTNVYGPLQLIQQVLPLMRKTGYGRIVNVSSGMGSLSMNSDPSFPYRAGFGPIYPASKTALNAITLAFALELEAEGIKVNAVTPGFTKTNLNNYEGTETVEEGASEAVRVALLKDGPTGTFTHATVGTYPW